MALHQPRKNRTIGVNAVHAVVALLMIAAAAYVVVPRLQEDPISYMDQLEQMETAGQERGK